MTVKEFKKAVASIPDSYNDLEVLIPVGKGWIVLTDLGQIFIMTDKNCKFTLEW
jgi:hypothetical protein